MRHYGFRSLVGSLLLGIATMASVLLAGCGGGGKSPATTGSSTNSGSNNSAGTTPLSPAEFVYTANLLDNTISQYQVAQNGALIPLATPTVATGAGPVSIATASSGHFLYVANSDDGTLSQYQVASNGSLTPLMPATVPTGTGAASATSGTIVNAINMVVDSASRFLYALNTSDHTLRVYVINANGTLTFQSVVAGIAAPSFIAIHPRLPVLYEGNTASSVLAQFKINADGSLSPLTSATVSSPASPGSLTLTPDGKFAYVSFDSSTTPARYQVNADGALSVLDLPGTNANNGGTPDYNVDPGSRFVYTGGSGISGAQISQFKIQSDGQLSPLSPAAIQVGVTEFAALFFDPSGQFAYLPDPLSEALLTFRIGSDGTLSAISTPAVATGKGPAFAASIQRSGRKRSAMRGRSAMTFVRR